jgi:hypothetical protein
MYTTVDMGVYGEYWSSTYMDIQDAYQLHFESANYYTDWNNGHNYQISIRCLK